MSKTHMKKVEFFETLCGISLPVNVPNVRWTPDRTFVDCKVCLKALEKRGG